MTRINFEWPDFQISENLRSKKEHEDKLERRRLVNERLATIGLSIDDLKEFMNENKRLGT